jgi:N-formylglutamate amidohydrolase
MHSVLSIEKPASALPLVFDSPHSGDVYPADFGYACKLEDLRRVEDTYVQELFEAAPDLGAAFLQAHFPRSYIDVNRALDDLDIDLIDGEWPGGPLNPTLLSQSGIGLVFRSLYPETPIYDRTLPPQEVLRRIEEYYRPYHEALKSLLDESYETFGKVWHINCHSMPSSTARAARAFSLGSRTVDIALGNRDGTTADRDFVHAARHFFRKAGYMVSINDPYKGAELVSRYSDPARGRHSLQIEVNRALYMNERTGEKTADFPKVQSDITNFIADCAGYAHSNLRSLAAE